MTITLEDLESAPNGSTVKDSPYHGDNWVKINGKWSCIFSWELEEVNLDTFEFGYLYHFWPSEALLNKYKDRLTSLVVPKVEEVSPVNDNKIDRSEALEIINKLLGWDISTATHGTLFYEQYLKLMGLPKTKTLVVELEIEVPFDETLPLVVANMDLNKSVITNSYFREN